MVALCAVCAAGPLNGELPAVCASVVACGVAVAGPIALNKRCIVRARTQHRNTAAPSVQLAHAPTPGGVGHGCRNHYYGRCQSVVAAFHAQPFNHIRAWNSSLVSGLPYASGAKKAYAVAKA